MGLIYVDLFQLQISRFPCFKCRCLRIRRPVRVVCRCRVVHHHAMVRLGWYFFRVAGFLRVSVVIVRMDGRCVFIYEVTRRHGGDCAAVSGLVPPVAGIVFLSNQFLVSFAVVVLAEFSTFTAYACLLPKFLCFLGRLKVKKIRRYFPMYCSSLGSGNGVTDFFYSS